MSKLTRIPAAGWFAIGVLVAAVLIPASAGAVSALTYTGIEGAGGGSYANVTKSGQLESTAAGASQMYVLYYPVGLAGSGIVGPPTGHALIVTSVHLDAVSIDVVPGDPPPEFALSVIEKNRGLTVPVETVRVTTPGVTVLPFDPGIAVPNGDYVSVTATNLTGDFTTVGYTVPASAVSSSAGPIVIPF